MHGPVHVYSIHALVRTVNGATVPTAVPGVVAKGRHERPGQEFLPAPQLNESLAGSYHISDYVKPSKMTPVHTPFVAFAKPQSHQVCTE